MTRAHERPPQPPRRLRTAVGDHVRAVVQPDLCDLVPLGALLRPRRPHAGVVAGLKFWTVLNSRERAALFCFVFVCLYPAAVGVGPFSLDAAPRARRGAARGSAPQRRPHTRPLRGECVGPMWRSSPPAPPGRRGRSNGTRRGRSVARSRPVRVHRGSTRSVLRYGSTVLHSSCAGRDPFRVPLRSGAGRRGPVTFPSWTSSVRVPSPALTESTAAHRHESPGATAPGLSPSRRRTGRGPAESVTVHGRRMRRWRSC